MRKMKKFCMLALFLMAISQSSNSNATILTITDEDVWQTTVGTWSTADFEGFQGPVNNQYAGVTFTGINGGSPYSTATFLHEGQNSNRVLFTEARQGGLTGFYVPLLPKPRLWLSN